MITAQQLTEKFTDKGYTYELYMFVFNAYNLFDPCSYELQRSSRKHLLEQHNLRMQPEWEYWNTWIDHQNYK